MITYIKKDVVERTAEKCGREPKDTAEIVDAVFQTLRDLMMDSNDECRVEIRQFGVFEVKNTAAKPRARNPKRPEEVIYVPPRRKTHFKPGKFMKQLLKRPVA